MLSADDEISTGDSSEPPDVPPPDPARKFLISELTAVKNDVDYFVDGFFHKRPSKDAAERLVSRMHELFKIIDEIYLPQAGQGGRIILERVRQAVRNAAIATSLLIEREPSIIELSDIHEYLLNLRQALTDILRSYDSSDEKGPITGSQ